MRDAQAVVQRQVVELATCETDAAAARQKPQDILGQRATDVQIDALLTPKFRELASYDPRLPLARLRCPVLALQGALDTQVPAPRRSAAWRAHA